MYQFLLGTSLLLIGMFVARPYCRFLCPLAVPLRWLSRLSKWHASITPNECINCRLCEDSCPFDAINRPGADRQTEDSGKGVRRLAVLLVLLPVLAAGGGFAGYAMHGFLAEAHRTVRLADQLVLEKQGAVESNLEIETFRASGSTRDELVAEASEVRESFAVGGTLVGVFAGLMFGIKLVGHSVHRKREGYEPDRAECLSCGRCFAYCPVEQSGKDLKEKE
jgi:ferredoxin